MCGARGEGAEPAGSSVGTSPPPAPPGSAHGISPTSISPRAPAAELCVSLFQLISITAGLAQAIYFPVYFTTCHPMLRSLLLPPHHREHPSSFNIPVFFRYPSLQAGPGQRWGPPCFLAVAVSLFVASYRAGAALRAFLGHPRPPVGVGCLQSSCACVLGASVPAPWVLCGTRGPSRGWLWGKTTEKTKAPTGPRWMQRHTGRGEPTLWAHSSASRQGSLCLPPVPHSLLQEQGHNPGEGGAAAGRRTTKSFGVRLEYSSRAWKKGGFLTAGKRMGAFSAQAALPVL